MTTGGDDHAAGRDARAADATPDDTSQLQKLRGGRRTVRPESIVAWSARPRAPGSTTTAGRVLADLALRGWVAGVLGIEPSAVAERVIFVLSGGCPGVISPHIVVVTREDVEGEPRAEGDQRLVVGRAGSEAILPEDIGRVTMMRKVATAVHQAMADAGIADPGDVHLAMVKVPGLTTASIKDASRAAGHRGHARPDVRAARAPARTRTTRPRSAWPWPSARCPRRSSPTTWSAATGTSHRRWSMTSSGGEKRPRRGGGVRQLDRLGERPSHRPRRDQGLHRRRGRSAGPARGGPLLRGPAHRGRPGPHRPRRSPNRSSRGATRSAGKRITLLDDHDGYQIGKAMAACSWRASPAGPRTT